MSFYRDGKLMQGYFCPVCRDKIMTAYAPPNPFAVINELFGVEVFKAQQSRKDLICEACGTLYSEFLNTGFVGCPECYNEFSPYISEVVARIQRKTVHVGKSPRGEESSAQYEELRLKIEHAVAEQNYEEAARLKRLLDELKEGKK